MANNYIQSSSFLAIPADKLEAAKEVCRRVVNQVGEAEKQSQRISDVDEEETAEEQSFDAYFNCNFSLDAAEHGNGDGVWFYGDESFDPSHCEALARSLVEELELSDPFICSWAYTCDKQRVDQFGGGAFVLAKGMPTHWIDAFGDCQLHFEQWRKSDQTNSSATA